MALIFEWDARKAEANQRKHGVTFEEAATVFGDVLSLTVVDPARSQEEARFVTIGRSSGGATLVVVHCERRDTMPIISARRAMPREVRQYEADTTGGS